MTWRLEQIVLNALLKKGREFMGPRIPSRQMRRLLNIYTVNENTGCINVPHYWAVILHDGRGPSPRDGEGLLIWFPNPNNDPRLRGGRYPVRRSDVRHLTKSEFQAAQRVNQQIIKRYKERTGKFSLTKSDYDQMNLYMIIAKRSPRNGGRVEGKYFMNNDAGMRGFGQEANRIGKNIAAPYMTNYLKNKGVLNKTIKNTFAIR